VQHTSIAPVIKDTHISDIKAGDTIVRKGKEMTVCAKDITRGFMGTAIFGDSYNNGHKPVKRVLFPRFHCGQFIRYASQ
jgi:hypothetical protein